MLGDKGSINIPFESGLVEFAQRTFLPDAVAYAVAVAVVAAYLLPAAARPTAAAAAAGLSTSPVVNIGVRSASCCSCWSSPSPCSTRTAASR